MPYQPHVASVDNYALRDEMIANILANFDFELAAKILALRPSACGVGQADPLKLRNAATSSLKGAWNAAWREPEQEVSSSLLGLMARGFVRDASQSDPWLELSLVPLSWEVSQSDLPSSQPWMVLRDEINEAPKSHLFPPDTRVEVFSCQIPVRCQDINSEALLEEMIEEGELFGWAPTSFYHIEKRGMAVDRSKIAVVLAMPRR